MYSVAKNVRLVIALLKEHDINQLVLSPGGTNAAFVRGVQDDPFFRCFSVVDERSALYFAIGIYLSTGKPVAVCCTSAQATRNYIPGLTEAFYKHVPILAITFSKHPQYTYQEYMQAPDQTSLPRDAVRATYSLPYVADDHDRMLCERLINEAILSLTHTVPAPVQLNVPMLDTELTQDSSDPLPDVKVIKRYHIKDIPDIKLGNKRILVVVGENRGMDDSVLVDFASRSNTAIYVNHLSNMQNDYTVNGNLVLTCLTQKEFDESLCPDILISIGGQTGDYPFYHKLAETGRKYEHWRISETGDIADTYDHLTKVFECSTAEFFSSLSIQRTENEYIKVWKEAVGKYVEVNDLPLSAAFVAQQMCELIPENSYVNFSILNSLRTWNLFRFKNRVNCFCNVGAFGIDGCMSTFLGQSVMVGELCFMFVGDLSFFYDMNSLGIRHIGNNVRIVLVNNNGGIEFKLGGSPERYESIDRYIAAAGHFKGAEGWAETNGFKYYSVKTTDEFIKVKGKLVEKSDCPILVEVRTSDNNESQAYSAITKANKTPLTVMQKIAGRVKRGISSVKK